jgi:arylsulfatase A-like enzyme
MPETAVTLAELLRPQGYVTAGFTTNGNVVSGLGFGRGFDVYEYLEESEESRRRFGVKHAERAAVLNEHAFTWLADRPRDRPFFLYLHAINPHDPYTPLPSTRDRLAAGVDPDLGSR